MKTFSMLNWDTPRDKMPAGLVGPIAPVTKKQTPELMESQFKIDNEQIFVAVSDDYFVVL